MLEYFPEIIEYFLSIPQSLSALLNYEYKKEGLMYVLGDNIGKSALISFVSNIVKENF